MRDEGLGSATPESVLRRLVWCEAFQRPDWQLPTASIASVDSYRRVLIGWGVAPEPVDGDVPRPVASLLAQGLCAQFAVTFAAGLGRPLAAGLFPRGWRVGRHFEWVTTSNPDDAERLFYDDLFPWSMQGQVAILSAPEGEVPALTEKQLEALSVPGVMEELPRTGAQGILLPGVDGQVAGLYLFSDHLHLGDGLRLELARRARAAGVEWIETSEDTFAA